MLPFVEDGTIILIGATTENPYFEVNPALLSRSVIFELKKLSTEDIRTLLLRAVNDTEKGMGSYHAQMDDDALEFLADMANGDARAALTAIELGILTTDRSEDGIIHITLDVASECIQKRVINYDKTGDNHYDTISAFIKSMRAGLDLGLDNLPTKFTGYERLHDDCTILAIVAEDELRERVGSGVHASIVLDKTPFYAEMGGQSADHGLLILKDAVFEVHDVQKNKAGKVLLRLLRSPAISPSATRAIRN